jgi:hypothetical protein
MGKFIALFLVVSAVVGSTVDRKPVDRIARPVGESERWVQIVNMAHEPMFYGELLKPNGPQATMVLWGVLLPDVFSPRLTGDLNRKYSSYKDAEGHFPRARVDRPAGRFDRNGSLG